MHKGAGKGRSRKKKMRGWGKVSVGGGKSSRQIKIAVDEFPVRKEGEKLGRTSEKKSLKL